MAVLIKTRRDGGASYASISVVAPVLASSRFRENLAPSFLLSFLRSATLTRFLRSYEQKSHQRATFHPRGRLGSRIGSRDPRSFSDPRGACHGVGSLPPSSFPSFFRLSHRRMRLVPVLFPNREKIRVFNDDERYDFANVSNVNLRESEKWEDRERKEEKERRNSFEENRLPRYEGS